jgi:glutathione S-transferase
VWFAHGSGPTAADFMMLYPLLEVDGGRGPVDLKVPAIMAWVKAVQAR